MNDNIREVSRLHREAMRCVDKSTVARLEDNREEYLRYTRLAYEKETAAAVLMEDKKDIEPTRSVLYRSAATLAYRCEMYVEAKRLIHTALGGNPPPEIEFELNDLLGKVKLAQSNIHLSDKHLRLTLDGNDIAFGRAPARTLATRIISVEEMLQATVRAPVPLFYDTVGAASFYVDLTLSAETQPTLPGFDNFDEIVEPFIRNLELLNRGETETLKETIADPSNYGEFVKAAIDLAPDGKAISSVNLQARIAGQIQAISFERHQNELSEIPIPRVQKPMQAPHLTEKTIRRVGFLQRADGSDGSVCELHTDSEGTWIIEVDEEIIHQILGKYWKKRVEVEGQRMKRTRPLKRIFVENLASIREISRSPDQTSLLLK